MLLSKLSLASIHMLFSNTIQINPQNLSKKAMKTKIGPAPKIRCIKETREETLGQQGLTIGIIISFSVVVMVLKLLFFFWFFIPSNKVVIQFPFEPTINASPAILAAPTSTLHKSSLHHQQHHLSFLVVLPPMAISSA